MCLVLVLPAARRPPPCLVVLTWPAPTGAGAGTGRASTRPAAQQQTAPLTQRAPAATLRARSAHPHTTAPTLLPQQWQPPATQQHGLHLQLVKASPSHLQWPSPRAGCAARVRLAAQARQATRASQQHTLQELRMRSPTGAATNPTSSTTSSHSSSGSPRRSSLRSCLTQLSSGAAAAAAAAATGSNATAAVVSWLPWAAAPLPAQCCKWLPRAWPAEGEGAALAVWFVCVCVSGRTSHMAVLWV